MSILGNTNITELKVKDVFEVSGIYPQTRHWAEHLAESNISVLACRENFGDWLHIWRRSELDFEAESFETSKGVKTITIAFLRVLPSGAIFNRICCISLKPRNGVSIDVEDIVEKLNYGHY